MVSVGSHLMMLCVERGALELLCGLSYSASKNRKIEKVEMSEL